MKHTKHFSGLKAPPEAWPISGSLYTPDQYNICGVRRVTSVQEVRIIHPHCCCEYKESTCEAGGKSDTIPHALVGIDNHC